MTLSDTIQALTDSIYKKYGFRSIPSLDPDTFLARLSTRLDPAEDLAHHVIFLTLTQRNGSSILSHKDHPAENVDL